MGREGATGDGGANEGHSERPGSRRSRLAGAAKQLEIAFEAVDLVEEPALGEALARAVRATESAARLERASPAVGNTAGAESGDEGRPRSAAAGPEEPRRGLVFGASAE